MTEAQKCKEIMNYFDEKIFNPALDFAKRNHNNTIYRGINITRARMYRLSSEKKIQFFWSAIVGTDKSIRFSDILKDNGITRFEDIIEEVRTKFNNDYLKA